MTCFNLSFFGGLHEDFTQKVVFFKKPAIVWKDAACSKVIMEME